MCFEEIELCPQNLLTNLDLIVNKFGGPMWFLKVHCQWSLINHSTLKSTPNVYGIDHNFFIYICERIDINLKYPSSIRQQRGKSNQIRFIYIRLKGVNKNYYNSINVFGCTYTCRSQKTTSQAQELSLPQGEALSSFRHFCT